MKIFKIEYNDPVAGWVAVSAGHFRDVHEAIATAAGKYDPDKIRISPGTLEDLAAALSLSPMCLDCGEPCGFEADGSLVCASCGARHEANSNEDYDLC
jgi:hypothetical protein